MKSIKLVHNDAIYKLKKDVNTYEKLMSEVNQRFAHLMEPEHSVQLTDGSTIISSQTLFEEAVKRCQNVLKIFISFGQDLLEEDSIKPFQNQPMKISLKQKPQGKGNADPASTSKPLSSNQVNFKHPPRPKQLISLDGNWQEMKKENNDEKVMNGCVNERFGSSLVCSVNTEGMQTEEGNNSNKMNLSNAEAVQCYKCSGNGVLGQTSTEIICDFCNGKGFLSLNHPFVEFISEIIFKTNHQNLPSLRKELPNNCIPNQNPNYPIQILQQSKLPPSIKANTKFYFSVIVKNVNPENQIYSLVDLNIKIKSIRRLDLPFGIEKSVEVGPFRIKKGGEFNRMYEIVEQKNDELITKSSAFGFCTQIIEASPCVLVAAENSGQKKIEKEEELRVKIKLLISSRRPDANLEKVLEAFVNLGMSADECLGFEEDDLLNLIINTIPK